METFSALLALCEGNSPVTSEFPPQSPMTRSFGVFFDLHLNKRLNKHSRSWWHYDIIMVTSSNGNIFRVAGPLWGEFTGHQWIPPTKPNDAELWCFLWCCQKLPEIWYTLLQIKLRPLVALRDAFVTKMSTQFFCQNPHAVSWRANQDAKFHIVWLNKKCPVWPSKNI